MDGLRLVLLIAGIVLVAGIYVFARFSRRGGRAPGDASETTVGDPGREAGGDPEGYSTSAHFSWSDDATPSHALEATAGDRGQEAGGDRERPGGGREERGIIARFLRRGGRRGDAALDDAPDGAARGARHRNGEDRGRRPGLESHTIGDDYDVNDLGGVFTPRREMSGAELSVDMSVLSGLRATYESTMDGLAPPADTEITDAGAPSTDAAGAADDAMDATDAADAGIADTGATEPAGAAEPADAAEQPALDLSRPIVHLLLLAQYERLPGRAILDALHAEGFRPGAMQLYYWLSDRDPSIAFGVANMVEPGALDPESLPGTETPGLVAFMCVPDDAAQAREILDAMIAASRRLAHRLDAALRDEARSTLSAQAENHLREKVTDIARRSRLQGG